MEANRFYCDDCGMEWSENDDRIGDYLFCPDCSGRLSKYNPSSLKKTGSIEKSEMTDEEKNENNTQGQGPMSKVLGFVGFGIGMVLMIAFIPLSESQGINFVVGAVIGIVGFVVGSWIGGLIDKQSDDINKVAGDIYKGVNQKKDLYENDTIKEPSSEKQIMCKKCGGNDFRKDGIWYTCKNCGNQVYM